MIRVADLTYLTEIGTHDDVDEYIRDGAAKLLEKEENREKLVGLATERVEGFCAYVRGYLESGKVILVKKVADTLASELNFDPIFGDTEHSQVFRFVRNIPDLFRDAIEVDDFQHSPHRAADRAMAAGFLTMLEIEPPEPIRLMGTLAPFLDGQPLPPDHISKPGQALRVVYLSQLSYLDPTTIRPPQTT
jgi:hypothetical protein